MEPIAIFTPGEWINPQTSLLGEVTVDRLPRTGRWTTQAIFDHPIPTAEEAEALLPTPSAFESTPTEEFVEEVQANLDDPFKRLYLPGRKWHSQRTLSRMVPAMLPTPTGDDANNVSRSSGTFSSLAREAHQMFPTPTNQASKHGETRDLGANAHGYNLWDLPHLLEDEAKLLPTPQAADAAGGRLERNPETVRTGRRPSGSKASKPLATALDQCSGEPTNLPSVSGSESSDDSLLDQLTIGDA